MLVLRNGAEKNFEVSLRRQADPPLRIATFRDVSTLYESTTELRERAERLAVIQDVGEAVSAAMSVDEIFVRLVKKLRHVAQFEYAGLAFHNAISDTICLEAIFKGGKFSPGKEEISLQKFRRLVGAPAGILENLPEGLSPFLGVEKAESVAALVLPGRTKDVGRRKQSSQEAEAVGCLVLASGYPRAFSQFHKQVLESIGHLLSAGIRKVQLWRQAQENYERLSLLSEASRDIGQSLELDQLLRNVVDAAKKTLNATAAAICVLNDRGKCGHVVAGMPEAAWDWPEADVRSILAKAKPDEVVSIPDIRRNGFFSDSCKSFLHERGLNAFLGAAVSVDQKPVALMGVFVEDAAKLRGGAVSIFSSLVAQTSRVLQNARLFQEVSETKNYLESVLKSSADAIVTSDRVGRVTYFSPGAAQMLGWQASEVVGRNITEFVNDAGAARQLFKQAMREKKVQSFECEVLHADGGRVPASLSLSQILDDAGRITGFLAIGKDISTRKQAEQENRRRGEELENYIYLISHNLKTPIVSIQGFVNLLLEELGPSLSQQNSHFLERIQKNAALMEKMIVDLFDFSRMSRLQPALGITRIQEIVNSVVDEMRPFEHMRDVEFDIAQDLPEVIADVESLQIVFENLLSNAVKYRRPGIPAKIKVGWKSQPRFYAFHVQDNGIGFDPAFKEKAFSLFQRGPNTGQIPGTGVGLALVKRIIENHQGLVRIESTPQVGTTIHFTLPKGLRREN
jgi:PAS domain S-box-containing protein